MSDDAVTEEVRATYDMVAAEYASRFSGTEPEQAVELAMIDHLISQLALPSRDVRDVAAGYRKLGYDVTLTRFHRTPDQVSGLLAAAGFSEEARLVRGPRAGERDDQAFLIARTTADDG